MVSILASRPSCHEFNSQHCQKNFRGKNCQCFEVNLQHCFEESGQWLENVVRAHLGLASGKLVLQKSHVIMAYECAAASLDYYQKEI